MKRCPTCQKTYADTMKFCQTDGTPLVEDKPSAPPADPFKTVVGSSKGDDILQIPDSYDPMKTMVSAPNVPKSDEPKKESAEKESSGSTSNSESKTLITPSKPLDPSAKPPSFGDSSPSTPSSDSASNQPSNARPFDATFSSIEPPAFGNSGKSGISPFDKPSDAPFGSSANESDEPPTAFGDSRFNPPKNPFETPKSSFNEPKTPPVPPPYKEPEPFNPGSQSPFGGQQSSDPWGSPQTPFGNQSNDPFGAPQYNAQNDWTPPPAPVASWQDQGVGANTPFQPPMGTAGQNNTLAIVSLVTGILSICLCGIFAAIPALITGYMAKNNADTNPAEYGGRGMALAGMILGAISLVFSVIYIIFIIINAVAR